MKRHLGKTGALLLSILMVISLMPSALYADTTATGLTLSSVAGKSVTTYGTGIEEAGPEGVYVNVSNSVSSVSDTSFVSGISGAKVTFYGTDSGFDTAVTTSVTLSVGEAKTVYVMVTSSDGSTSAYYAITINRQTASTSGSTSGSSSGSSSSDEDDHDTKYKITVSSSSCGLVTVSESKAKEGTLITVNTEPDDGYTTYSVKVTGYEDDETIEVRQTAEGVYTFVMPDERVKVTATFTYEIGSGIDYDSDYGTDQGLSFALGDVSSGSWYYNAINYMVTRGYMTGTSQTEFSPNTGINRAMVVTMLYRMAGSPTVRSYGDLSDVEAGSYYEKAVGWACSNSVVTGYSDGTFRPYSYVTRAELATILCRYGISMGKTAYSGYDLANFSDDLKIPTYARFSMSWVVGAGIMNGMGDGSISPLSGTTRAQAAAMFYRLALM